MSRLPENLEKVAEAGSWDARAVQLEKERQKTYKELAKIKKEHWVAMGAAFKSMGELVDRGGFGGLISGSMDRLEIQIQNQMDKALAPIMNELGKLLDTIFDEPFVQGLIAGMQDVFKAALKTFNAILTGQWNELFLFMQNSDLFGPLKVQWEEFKSLEWARSEATENMIYNATGMTYNELNAQATAGGVQSGQFDATLSAIAQYLQDQGLL